MLDHLTLAVLLLGNAALICLAMRQGQRILYLQSVVIPWLNRIGALLHDDYPPIPEPPIKG